MYTKVNVSSHRIKLYIIKITIHSENQNKGISVNYRECKQKVNILIATKVFDHKLFYSNIKNTQKIASYEII